MFVHLPILFIVFLFLPVFTALFLPREYRKILNYLGIMTTILGCAMLAPMWLDLVYMNQQWLTNGQAFGVSAAITIFNGLMIFLSTRHSTEDKNNQKQVFVLTGLTWLFLPLIAALPFILSNTTTSLTDSFFEAISAMTTTGATALTGIDFSSPGIVLWRSLLQWLGGIGIIVIAITLFPELNVGVGQLSYNEFSETSDKIFPRASVMATKIISLYAIMTFLCFLLLLFSDMGILDAVCHAMSILSTGGFSTRDFSICAFNSLWVEMVAMVFMFLSGTTLILYIRLFYKKESRIFLKDEQFRAYVTLVCVAGLIFCFWEFYKYDKPFLYSLRTGFFSAISLVTTSGFTNCERDWDGLPGAIVLFLIIIGGCSGSTASGLKIFRVQLMFRMIFSQIKKAIHPYGVFVAKINKRPIESHLGYMVFTFITLYLTVGASLSVMLSLCQLDLTTSVSGAFSCLSNFGPGLGDVISSGNYASLPTLAKWGLMAGMIVGRLEILTIMVLLMPQFWRR